MGCIIEFEDPGCLCWLKDFTANGIIADTEDFVYQYDHDPDCAPAYGCGDMHCDKKEPTQAVLEKYGITNAEYEEVVQAVCKALDFGRCRYCD